jgi:type I restriction enzyme S subunit
MTLVVPFEDVFKDETKLLAKHESWERVELGEVCEVLNGFAFKSTLFNKSEGVPLVRIRDLERGRTETFYKGEYPREYVVKNGDLLVGMDGNFGCYEWRGGEALLNQRICKLIPRENYLDRKFLLFGVNGYLKAIQEVTSSVTVGHLSSRDIQRIPFPFPPLNEQRRIVARLEKLLNRVDTAQGRLATIPRILKRFRQSVLAAASSGKLTTDWREKTSNHSSASLVAEIREGRKELWSKQRKAKGLAAKLMDYPQPVKPSDEFEFNVPNSWELCSMDSLTSVITSGSRDWKRYYRDNGSGTFIMAQNIRPMRFDRSYRLGVAPPENDRDRVRSETLQDDLLVTIVGANTGDSCRVQDELREHYVCQSVALMRPVVPSTSPFLELFLNSADHGLAQYKKWIYGEGRPHLSFNHLRETLVCLPPLAEQQEIVRRVEALFKTADALEARYRKAKAYVDKLTQSILAKAFRGDLVPQDPNDEPASVLLERIRENSSNVKAVSKVKEKFPRTVKNHRRDKATTNRI